MLGGFSLVGDRQSRWNVGQRAHRVDVQGGELPFVCSQQSGDVDAAIAADEEVGRLRAEAVVHELRRLGDPEAHRAVRIRDGTRAVSPAEGTLTRSNGPLCRRLRSAEEETDRAAMAAAHKDVRGADYLPQLLATRHDRFVHPSRCGVENDFIDLLGIAKL